MTTMSRFLGTYRWELVLLIVVPAATAIAGYLAMAVSASLWDIGLTGSRYFYFGNGVAGSLVVAVLLGVFYARVRRLGREFLTLVWGYALALRIVGAVLSLVFLAVAPLFVDPQDAIGEYLLSFFGFWLLVGLAQLPVLLVFARRASGISLAHAFFLFLIVQSYALPDTVVERAIKAAFDLPSASMAILLAIPVVAGIGLVTGCVLAWLLGNFASRQVLFRRRVVLALLAAQVMLGGIVWMSAWSSLFLLELVVVTFGVSHILPLALIYLIRVREPISGSLEPPVDSNSQG
ncbi:MAG: hypothetical protein OXK21_02110 [Chloroflexota bacterium]|nr:hypothetical protein [Chloroflexota bacterium]